MNNTIEMYGKTYDMDDIELSSKPYEFISIDNKHKYAFLVIGYHLGNPENGKLELRCAFDDQETRDLKYNQIKEYKEAAI